MKVIQFLICICFTLNVLLANAEATKLNEVQKNLSRYYKSGNYHHEQSQSLLIAKKYILSQLKNKSSPQTSMKKIAVILDIDDTALDHIPYLIQRRFCVNKKELHSYMAQVKVKANQPVLRFYQWLLNHSIKIFFITSRDEQLHELTTQHLKKAGYKTWHGLYLKSPKYQNLSNQNYKTKIRQTILQSGYRILVNIGDHPSDIEGGFSEIAILLPNPFYQGNQCF